MTKNSGIFNFERRVCRPQEAKKDLIWWVNNLKLSNGRSLMNPKPLITITSNASMKDWGTYCQDQRTGRPRSKLQTKEHINILELKAAKCFILTFTKIFSQAKITHLQMDNIAALSYIAKMGAAPTTKFCQI